MIMPDQRGFGATDKPQDVADYATDNLVADLFALADALGIDEFALVGHDWGGAVAWAAALRGSPRITRLAIVNSPHPLIFQRSLIDDPAQRAACSISMPSAPRRWSRGSRGRASTHSSKRASHRTSILRASPPDDRQIISHDWAQPGALTAMLNWYRASQIHVPATRRRSADARLAEARRAETAQFPTLVVWGLDDKALLPLPAARISARSGRKSTSSRSPASAISRRGKRPSR